MTLLLPQLPLVAMALLPIDILPSRIAYLLAFL